MMTWVATVDALPPIGESVLVWMVPEDKNEWCAWGLLDYDCVWINPDQYRLENVHYWLKIEDVE